MNLYKSYNVVGCITDYIDVCEVKTVPTRTVRCFSTNKPQINPDIKAPLREKTRVSKSGNKDDLKTVQEELRRKMEKQLQQNNISGIWRGLKTISAATPLP